MTDFTAPATRTVKVKVRHSIDCKHRNEGTEFRGCDCPKALSIYEGAGSGSNKLISAKTRSWAKAEDLAQEYRDRFNPDKQELKRLRAVKEAQQVSIEEAVSIYYGDMKVRQCSPGTIGMARSLFGHIDPETKAITKNGHLFNWLSTLTVNDRPTCVADLNPAHLTAWRSTWEFGDYTAAQRWGMVKGFLNFCEVQGWISVSPARKIRRLEYEKGSRTAIFTDHEYNRILEAVAQYAPENRPEETRKVWQQRLTTFVELLRWSGMAMIDAVQYRPELVDSDGVLQYRRKKTDILATVPLPQHLIVLLRDVPLEKDSVGTSMPFRMKHYSAHSDTVTWRKRLFKLFDLAGIKSVRTEQGTMRRPHPHMFRDTFAVGMLRHGAKLHTVSKMLGHSKTTITEQAYLPWCSELKEAHIADARKALAQATPKKSRLRVINR
ncbi:MAG TPA: tyrosine-type recombinase/integrase [Candidatus Acidoferrales bacterium]|jgi:integrase|nr:tyrosine-type recombinase/integrase [Candidatus Acidoferrales bacterium]